MTKIECICENPKCNKIFLRYQSEVKRSERLNRRLFCSMKCSGDVNKINLPDNPPTSHLKNINRRDRHTGLREHLRRVKNRNRERNKNYNITLDDLLSQWEKQKGMCPYTGIKLIHPIDRKDEPLFHIASLDRIDSTKGYVRGNIQFVSASANLAKSKLTDDEMVEFCYIITKHWSLTPVV